MGAVYRATDTRLGRHVALKIVPEKFARDRQRMGRFQREAEVLASLDHPNISTIHGLEVDGDVQALVLELVEGPTLAERITEGPIPTEEALGMALEIAQALEAAHEKGIIHRDLKPANVKITPEGKVKVLDFGLAKALDPELTQHELINSPTLTMEATQEGVILGTAAYMSPEQARGKPVDTRTDIWAFGSVLLECLTGVQEFGGETISDSIAKILQKEPDWEGLPKETPPAIRRLLRRCLEKDPYDRVQHIGDARIEIRHALEHPSDDLYGEVATASPARWQRALPLLAAALIAVLATVLLFWFAGPGWSSTPASAPVSRTTITLPDGQRQPRVMGAPLAISPDGTLLAYVARDRTGSHLFLRSMDSFGFDRVPDSEDAGAPFFSPHGNWIGFFTPGKLKKASVNGGPPIIVADASGPGSPGANWGVDDFIVFAPNMVSGLWRVSADGGTPERLTRPDFGEDGRAHVWPQHLPGGQVLFSVWGGKNGPEVRILDLESGRMTLAHPKLTNGIYLSSGHLAFGDLSGNGSFLAAPFDLKELAVSGSDTPVLNGVRLLDSKSAYPYIAISQTGTAVYVTHEMGETTLMKVGRDGAMTTLRTKSQGAFADVRLSPDGKTAVFHDEQGRLWSLDIRRKAVSGLFSGKHKNAILPIWHPDGRHVTVASAGGAGWDLYEIDVEERGEPRLLLPRQFPQFPSSWSGDGRLLLYFEIHPQTGSDIWVLPRDEEPEPVLQSPANETSPVFSPNGRFLAYVSDESGQRQVYLKPYPKGSVVVVSIDGGTEPVWSRDGSELFFRHGDEFLAVRFTSEPEIQVSVPAVLFDDLPLERTDVYGHRSYDVAPDGQYFLAVSDRPTTEFKVIQNWFEELERKVPTK